MRLSVIIPTLNEAHALGRTVSLVRSRGTEQPAQIIVADCGSTDPTVRLARRWGLHVVTHSSLDSRARACNAGAEAATGDTLLFLHADSQVPAGFDRRIRRALEDPCTVGGAFEFKLDGTELRLRLVERINRLRYRVLTGYYGDQGIFVRRTIFDAAGGYPNMPIMEDRHFCRMIGRFGSLKLVRAEMWTSPRRFYHGGILRTLAMDALIWAWDELGLDPSVFADRYRRENIGMGGRRLDSRDTSVVDNC